MIINNFEQIIGLLDFPDEDSFYHLQVLLRKKDLPEHKKARNNNARCIKTYYIKSKEYLLSKQEEIISLCELFTARASIRLNKRSFEKTAFQSLTNISNALSNREYRFINKCYDRACGQKHNDENKKWILDVDKGSNVTVLDIKKALVNIKPLENKKYITTIPSKTGFHVITSPFNVMEFNNFISSIEIHKDNPTNLFIP